MTIRTTNAAAPAPSPRRQRWALKAAATLLVAGAAGGLYWRYDAGGTPPAAASPTLAVAPGSPDSIPTQPPAAAAAHAASSAASAAQAVGWPAPRPSLPPEDTPAEALQKVQQALSNGSPQETLHAAYTLSACASLASVSEKLAAAGLAGLNAQDLRHYVPPELEKKLESMGAYKKETAEVAERQQRRCQVFDAATLARRGELFKQAYEGDPQGAAKAYLSHLTLDNPQGKADPQLLASLRADARRAAESGDLANLAGWAFGGDTTAQQMGFSLVETRAYREAYHLILDEGLPGNSADARKLAAQMEKFGSPPATLSAEQQREVDALAQRILEAYRQRWRQPTGG